MRYLLGTVIHPVFQTLVSKKKINTFQIGWILVVGVLGAEQSETTQDANTEMMNLETDFTQSVVL